MEWVLILVAGGAAVWGGRHLRDRRIEREVARRELEAVRNLADEDVTLLGEELSRLDAEVGRLDEDGRADYQTALDAYESAQRAASDLDSPEEISKITDTLSAGRYAVTCVRARLGGESVPEWRTPCFFNPQHGPSVRDVPFRLGGMTRQLPACAQDAARVDHGERPEVRTVKIGSSHVPYWRAGSVYLPYAKGYFVGTAVVATAFVGGSPFASDAGGLGYGGGDVGGGDFGGGGWDGGSGWDGGGGDAGGGADIGGGGFDGGGGGL